MTDMTAEKLEISSEGNDLHNFTPMGWTWRGMHRYFDSYSPPEGWHIVTGSNGNQWIEEDDD